MREAKFSLAGTPSPRGVWFTALGHALWLRLWPTDGHQRKATWVITAPWSELAMTRICTCVYHFLVLSWYIFLNYYISQQGGDQRKSKVFLNGGQWKYLTFLNLVSPYDHTRKQAVCPIEYRCFYMYYPWVLLNTKFYSLSSFFIVCAFWLSFWLDNLLWETQLRSYW